MYVRTLRLLLTRPPQAQPNCFTKIPNFRDNGNKAGVCLRGSTHPLTSRANLTCLTRLSAPWSKERETLPKERGNKTRKDVWKWNGEGIRPLLVPLAVKAESCHYAACQWSL
ncbi:hypothetical protein Q8A73_019968 [Channa argus]|nr:hypothetical protein Q8A73_019968 [Channa argus]